MNPKNKGSNQHACSVCQKTYKHQSQLERHFRVHTGERPFQCKICGKAFKTLGTVNMHSAVHSDTRLLNACFVKSFLNHWTNSRTTFKPTQKRNPTFAQNVPVLVHHLHANGTWINMKLQNMARKLVRNVKNVRKCFIKHTILKCTWEVPRENSHFPVRYVRKTVQQRGILKPTSIWFTPEKSPGHAQDVRKSMH